MIRLILPTTALALAFACASAPSEIPGGGNTPGGDDDDGLPTVPSFDTGIDDDSRTFTGPFDGEYAGTVTVRERTLPTMNAVTATFDFSVLVRSTAGQRQQLTGEFSIPNDIWEPRPAANRISNADIDVAGSFTNAEAGIAEIDVSFFVFINPVIGGSSGGGFGVEVDLSDGRIELDLNNMSSFEGGTRVQMNLEKITETED